MGSGWCSVSVWFSSSVSNHLGHSECILIKSTVITLCLDGILVWIWHRVRIAEIELPYILDLLISHITYVLSRRDVKNGFSTCVSTPTNFTALHYLISSHQVWITDPLSTLVVVNMKNLILYLVCYTSEAEGFAIYFNKLSVTLVNKLQWKAHKVAFKYSSGVLKRHQPPLSNS